MAPRLVLPALLLLAAACSGASDPDSRRVVGVIALDAGAPDPPGALAAPDTVAAGAPFTVTVTTRGSSSCTRADGAELELRGLLAEIVPYDRDGTRLRACTDDLHAFPRDVTVRFAAPGRAVVRVRGRDLRGGPAVVEAGVVVRP
ncbi:MAG TPA: hypothetical protein VFQ76_00890 [Longimicrobiaceae bacterium]|nr:hypothetical protein [Longimicrobiaceae bacterium]